MEVKKETLQELVSIVAQQQFMIRTLALIYEPKSEQRKTISETCDMWNKRLYKVNIKLEEGGIACE